MSSEYIRSKLLAVFAFLLFVISTFLYVSPKAWHDVVIIVLLMIIGLNSLNEFFLFWPTHSTYKWMQLSLNMLLPMVLYLEKIVMPGSILITVVTVISWFFLTILLKFVFRRTRVVAIKQNTR